MRLDNKQVSANILNSGDNLILCSCLQEAFFDIYSVEIQGESFIKKADRVIDGCPIIKLNVEHQGIEYKDVEFKLVSSDSDEVFINETLLQHGFEYAAPAQSLCIEQQLCEIAQEPQYIEHEPQPIEIVVAPSASMLKEQARNSQEQRIKKTLSNIYNKLNEQLKQQLHQAKTSMLQETLASQMQMQNQSQQKLDESVKGLQHEFTDLSKQLQKVARNFTDDAVAKFKGTVVEQCNALLQETNVQHLEQLQLQIKKNAVDAKDALQQNLKKSFQEKFQQLSAQHTEHHQQVQVFVEQQLQNMEQQIKLQQIKTFEDSVAALMNDQSMFVDNVVNGKISFIQESLHSLSQQLQQTLLQQMQSSQSDAQQHLQQISEQVHGKLATVDNIVSSAVADASAQLTQHVDSLNASRLATVEQQVEQILREQFAQAAQDTVVEEASQNQAISTAINKFKSQLNKDLQAQAATLQSELYRKFAVYVDSMGGGGGSVAVQYANGGTMNGSLNVATGQILSGGVDISTLWGGGSGPSGEPLFTSWAQTYSANYQNTYSTVQTYSASWGTGGAPQTLSFNESNAQLTISSGNTVSLSALSGASGIGSTDRLINGSYQVILSGDGNLTFEGGGYIGSQYGAPGWLVTPAAAGGIASADGQQYIQINNDQGIFIGTSWPLSAYEWTFGRDGGLKFPDGTVQTTAFTDLLSALSDVSIPAPTNGQVLTYNSTTNKWNAGAPLSAAGATGYYGSFYDERNQSATTTTSAYVVAMSGTFESNGISLSSNNIVFQYAGTYEIIYSIQIVNTHNNQEDIQVWFTRNGIDIPISNSVFTINAKSGTESGKIVMVTPFIVTVAAGEIIGLKWNASNVGVTIDSLPANTTPPTPSAAGVIVTAKQVTNVQVPGSVTGNYLPLSGGSLTGVLSTNQDIEITDVTKGIILKSPGGIKYRITVSDAGELITTSV